MHSSIPAHSGIEAITDSYCCSVLITATRRAITAFSTITDSLSVMERFWTTEIEVMGVVCGYIFLLLLTGGWSGGCETIWRRITASHSPESD